MAYSELTPQRTTSTSISVPITAFPEDDSCCYDVFINHRGPDVKRNFGSHLYRRFLLEKVRVFLDQPELQKGLDVRLQIEYAIRSAFVHLALFSPTYAESKCCLNELVQMIESMARGARIIPVFYHVRPDDLNGESGVYAESLRKLEKESRHDPSTIQKWREALSLVSHRSCFEVDADNTFERE